MKKAHRVSLGMFPFTVVVLAACTNPPGQPVVPIPVPVLGPQAMTPEQKLADLVKKLRDTTDEDVSNAIKLATTMKDTQAVDCFTFVQKQLPVLRSQVDALTAKAGPLTTFEAGHILIGVGRNGLPQKAEFEKQCGPFVLNVAGDINFILGLLNKPALAAIKF
jgi:hypothetical protein